MHLKLKTVSTMVALGFVVFSIDACVIEQLPTDFTQNGGAQAGTAGTIQAQGGSSAEPDSGADLPEAGATAASTGGGFDGRSGSGGSDAGAGGESNEAGSTGQVGGGTSSAGNSGSAGSGGSSTAGTGGTGPTGPCATPVCKAGEVQTETRNCGECSDKQSRKRTCRSDTCTWGEWGGWSGCAAECKPDQWRCCGAGKWEWCYTNSCRWTRDCEPCSASSCPECH